MPSPINHTFIFASLDSKAPSTARKVHIRRLYDIFQFSISKGDFPRARRAWAILVRCKEIDWMSMWSTGLLLLGGSSDNDETSQEKLDFLRTMMLQNVDERECILQELLFRLILRGQCKEALSELELYLPAFPFQDNPVLHLYAGMISLFLAQPSSNEGFNPILTRDAQSHFEHAKKLDQDNVVAQAFLERIPELQASSLQTSQPDQSEDEMDEGSDSPRTKRVRI